MEQLAQSIGEQLCLGLGVITPFSLRCFDPSALGYIGYLVIVLFIFAATYTAAKRLAR